MKLSMISPSFYPAVVYGGPVFTALHTAEELAKLDIEVRVSATNANMTKYLNIESNIWHKWNEKLYVKYYHDTIIHKFSFALFFNNFSFHLINSGVLILLIVSFFSE